MIMMMRRTGVGREGRDGVEMAHGGQGLIREEEVAMVMALRTSICHFFWSWDTCAKVEIAEF